MFRHIVIAIRNYGDAGGLFGQLAVVNWEVIVLEKADKAGILGNLRSG